MKDTVLTNRVECKIDFDKFDEKYEIYQISTERKYIDRGSRLLDAVFTKEDLKALSFTYESGRSAFAMFESPKDSQSAYAMFSSGSVRLDKINERLKSECKDDPTLFAKRVYSSQFKEKEYILLRLMLNSLANHEGEGYRYNNLSGKFYIIQDTLKSSITALQISFDYNCNMNANATTFSRMNNPNWGWPAYVRGGNEKSLIRIYGPNGNDEPIYQKKSFNGKKARIPFLIVWTRKNEEKKLDDKAAYMYLTLNKMNKMFGDCLEQELHFAELVIKDDAIKYDEVKIDYGPILERGVNLINGLRNENDPDVQADFELFRKALSKFVKVTVNDNLKLNPNDDIIHDGFNIIMYRNKDYYDTMKIEDPYSFANRADNVVQAVTYDDFVSKIKGDDITESAYRTILKELLIKWDIVHNKKITMANWAGKHYPKDWIFAERDEKDGKQTTYFLRIEPSGDFKCFYATAGGFDKLDRECQKLFMVMNEEMDSSYKQGIMDSFGNIMLIGKEGRMIMPKEKAALERVSKRNEDFKEFRRGLYGVNLYECPEDQSIILYSVSQTIKGITRTLPNAVLIYKCKAVQGDNTIADLISTFAVPFVKLNSFTVLPYPFKYVREYMEMERWRIEDFRRRHEIAPSFRNPK